MRVVLKSDLFGDRSVNVNMPSKMNDRARTGDGGHCSVIVARTPIGYSVEFNRRNEVKKEVFEKRKVAAMKAAAFLNPIY